MRKPTVIQINQAVARTAFLLDADISTSGLCLVLSRLGKDSNVGRFSPLFVDNDGYIIFDWDDKFRCLPDGLYLGSFEVCGEPCATVMMQFKHGCRVLHTINTSRNHCHSVDDMCHVCSDESCESACDVKPDIYIPAYDIRRGC